MRNVFMAVKKFLPLLVLAVWGITLQSCEETPITATADMAKIEGKVVDKGTSTPIEKALVKALPFNRSVETDASGKYALSIELPDTFSATVKLVISKTGFINDSLMAVIIQNDHVTTAPEIKLGRTGGSSGQGSGDGTNIVLVDATSTSIFVKGSGGLATSKMTFEVRDGYGVPVDLQHQVTVSFNMSGGPGGGEVLTPAAMATDANGRASTTLTSGTKAGALQVIASFRDKQNQPIAGAPVPIAIHGGLPDNAHFSVVSERLNFAGYNIFGLINRVTAFVGDKYSNPVPPGTIVHFQSTGGIIEGSAITDALGRASVSLVSASPQPQGITGYPAPFNEPGFALITAETVDEKGAKIKKATVVLFSGRTQFVQVTPSNFSLAAFATQGFTFTVKDQNKNPLVAGTTINVTADAGKLSGNTNIALKDTQSRGATEFSFWLTNAQPDSLDKDASIKIDVISQNGDASTTIFGKLLGKR